MAHLEEMAEQIPTILKSRFRLGPLRAEQATAAIVQPAGLDRPGLATPTFSWSPEALECTLDFLRKRKSGSGRTEVGHEVEPFQLQLVCQFVEDLVREKQLTEVGGNDLGGEPALERILARFYQDSIDTLCRKFRGFRLRRRLENLCENGFISAKGRRLLREESTIAESNRVSPRVLAEMVQLRLLRKEPRVGDNYYELSHDTLIAPILARRQRHERRRRQRWATVAVATVAITAGVLWSNRSDLAASREETQRLERWFVERDLEGVKVGLVLRDDTTASESRAAFGAFLEQLNDYVRSDGLTFDVDDIALFTRDPAGVDALVNDLERDQIHLVGELSPYGVWLADKGGKATPVITSEYGANDQYATVVFLRADSDIVDSSAANTWDNLVEALLSRPDFKLAIGDSTSTSRYWLPRWALLSHERVRASDASFSQLVVDVSGDDPFEVVCSGRQLTGAGVVADFRFNAAFSTEAYEPCVLTSFEIQGTRAPQGAFVIGRGLHAALGDLGLERLTLGWRNAFESPAGAGLRRLLGATGFKRSYQDEYRALYPKFELIDPADARAAVPAQVTYIAIALFVGVVLSGYFVYRYRRRSHIGTPV